MNCLGLIIIFLLRIDVVLALQDNVLLPGDVVLAGLHEVTTHEDGSCGQVIPESVQTYEAVRWFFRMLNERDYIPGVTLGYHAFQTCGQPSRAVQQTLNILKTYGSKQGLYLNGLLGPERSSETQPVSRLLSSLPADDRLPQISYSATAASLSNRNVYKNLFRVIQTDEMQVEVIVRLMKALDWNYVGIVYENDTYGRGAAEALRTLAEEMEICVPVMFNISTDASTIERRKVFSSLADQLEHQQSPVLGVVFFGHVSTAEDMFEYIGGDLSLESFQLIVSESLALDQVYVRSGAGDIYPRAKGLLTPSPPYFDVELFRQYWADLHANDTLMLQQLQGNNWLLQYLEYITGCSFGGSSSVDAICLQKATDYILPNERLPMYIHYAILGAATFAKAFKDLHEKECSSISGLCPVLNGLSKIRSFAAIENISVSPTEFDRELQNFNLSFGFSNGNIRYGGSDGQSTYDVYNFQTCGDTFCFVKIGTYINHQFSFTGRSIKSFVRGDQETEGAVQAQCQPSFTCNLCSTTGHYGKVFFIPGDFYIVGLLPIHYKKPNSLQCGELRESSLSVDIAEAAHYAINTLNRTNGPLKFASGNFTFGLVLMDTCMSAFVNQERVTRFNSGLLKLNKNTNSSDILDKVIGYIGPAHSSVTVPLGSVMNEVKKVYISPSATSTSLSNRQRFPYFMRTCSPDYKQANVIMELAKLMGSKYVQILYSGEEYGRAGRDELLKAAKERSICVAQSLAVPDTTDIREFQGYISDIRKYHHARLLIVFLLFHMLPGFLGILNSDMKYGEFVFIGAEGWAQSEKLLKYSNNVNANLRGSLTITQKLPKNAGFEEHYQNVDIQKSPNPWLQDYMEARAKCYFPKSYNKQHNKACTPDVTDEYRKTDSYVPFTINTVYALAVGFHTAVQSLCGASALCPEYSTQRLIDNLKNVELDLYNNNKSIRIFDDNGEGSLGYTISQIVRVGENLQYREIGVSSDSGIVLFVSLQSLKETNFASSCPNENECSRCTEQFNVAANASVQARAGDIATQGPAFIGLVCSVGVLSLALLILTVCLVCHCRKGKMKEDPYLTVIPGNDHKNSTYDSIRRPKSADSFVLETKYETCP